MSKMAELHAEINYPEITIAECAECGEEIYFTTNEEFARLATAHACTRLV